MFGESPNRMYCARNTAAQTITESVIRRRDEYQCCHRRAGATTGVRAEGATTGVRPIRLGSGLESGLESEEVIGSIPAYALAGSGAPPGLSAWSPLGGPE